VIEVITGLNLGFLVMLALETHKNKKAIRSLSDKADWLEFRFHDLQEKIERLQAGGK